MCWGLHVALSHNPCPLHSKDKRDAKTWTPPWGWCFRKHRLGGHTFRVSFDVCLGVLGVEESYMREGASANEIQGTKGVDEWGEPWKKSTRSGGPQKREGGWGGDLAFHS